MKYKKKRDGLIQIGATDVLIYDIETDSLDINTAKLKFFGAYSFKHNTYFFYTGNEIKAIQQLIDDHYVVAGYNSKSFDRPICENNGLSFEYKVNIDLMRVLFIPETRRSVRENIIKVDGKILKDILPNHKLKTIAEVLKLSVQKGGIDYKIFQKDCWSNNELNEILKYLYYDVRITKELFEFFYKEFLPLKEYMSPDDQRKYNWMRTSPGSYVYKVICYQAKLPEEYNDIISTSKKYEGAFVSEPDGECYVGKIYCLDYNSSYPHNFMHGNLYSHGCTCCTDDEKWNGNDLFPVDGKYCVKNMGNVEQVIKRMFVQRLEYKKNKDSRQFALKIILNTLYGVSGSAIFKSLYSLTTASDCTLMARQTVKLSRDIFSQYGYIVIYSDTDSVYLQDSYGDEKRLLDIKNLIIDKIKNNVPFPQDTFDMSIDERIKAIWFFKDSSNKFKKKNYVYITEDDRIKIKGLSIIKSNCSRLSQHVFNKLKHEIIERCDIKFDKKYIKEIILELIKEDLTLVANYYKVKPSSAYKDKSSIQYQISLKYGEGEHYLVPNNKIGNVGKGRKYCSLEEAKELTINDLELDNVWNELSPFIRKQKETLWTAFDNTQAQTLLNPDINCNSIAHLKEK